MIEDTQWVGQKWFCLLHTYKVDTYLTTTTND